MILIIDLGGQYCHLIRRTLEDQGVRADIRYNSIPIEEILQYKGIILSGGPNSVYADNTPSIPDKILALGIPILGICYGHQLLAQMLGGKVKKSDPEYGHAKVEIFDRTGLFDGLEVFENVWMSHNDAVTEWPEDSSIVVTASTANTPCAAFAHKEDHIYGIQWHPEVYHTECGEQILLNFAKICDIEPQEEFNRAEQIIDHIKTTVGDRKVFFFVSGGVDSTVAFALCAKALGRDRVLAVYIDTGFMRKHETHEIQDLFHRFKMADRLHITDCSQKFMSALAGITDPEEKREIIGRLFVQMQQSMISEFVEDDWLLGQGTIYPDVIESGKGDAAKIKTHHNRCAEILAMIEQGRVVEPLRDLYKDQVRQLGRDIGVPGYFIERWPFPGPGLAIRCLCTTETGPVEDVEVEMVRIPLRSVGVQGDARTYRSTLAMKGCELSKEKITEITKLFPNDRVITHIAGDINLRTGVVKAATLTESRIAILREADFVVRSAMMSREGLVWQFPVVLIPLSFGHGETIVLRPVRSRDGMTADFVIPPSTAMTRIIKGIMAIQGVDAIFLDVSDKPPATIEWE